MNKSFVAMLALLSLVACATNNKTDTTTTQAPSEQAMSGAEDLQAQADQLGKESVFFDFDKSNVKSEYQDGIKQQADFMLANKNDSVTVIGNCDERGSAEYNLALGERRAYAVEKQLAILGVDKGRIKTVSNGESKPRETCHAEKCWKENRRVDFVHQLGQ